VNVVLVSGVIARPPSVVRLADGREVLSLSLAVASDEGSTAVPVVVESPTPTVRALVEGDEVSVHGTIRRRFFRAGGRVASPTEVVARSVVRARQRARVRRQRDAVLDLVQGAGSA